MIEIYTDGSCRKNPGGEGGWGIVVKEENGYVLLGGGDPNTTNNRMELTALISALDYALDRPNERFEIYCDSAYCVNMCSDWIHNWSQNGWRTASNKQVENIDLVQAIYQKLAGFPNFTIRKVKGHAGNLDNELADALAKNDVVKLSKLIQQNDINIIKYYNTNESEEL